MSYPDSGSPQGGVVSPLLSNIFLHYVLDQWFEQEVKPRLKSRAFLILGTDAQRWSADDFVIGFRDHSDAQRVMEVIPKRLGKYGLTVHPTKTKLVRFQPPSSRKDRNEPPDDCPGTFDLLGFTHYWDRSRKGNWVVKLKTAADRFARAVRSIDSWCRDNRHQPLRTQQQKLNEKLRGHYAYYGVTGNSTALSRFLHEVEHRWRTWLLRRNRERALNWTFFRRLLQRLPLARARTVHSIYSRAANP
ncbi:MAG: reverse transcriptase domain-containing protein [Planctomycetales bacterium]